MLIKDEEVIKHFFYSWLYRQGNYISHLKWTTEAKKQHEFSYSQIFLMRRWHNHVSPAGFALEAEHYGYCYHTAKKVVKDIVARKKMEELLDA